MMKNVFKSICILFLTASPLFGDDVQPPLRREVIEETARAPEILTTRYEAVFVKMLAIIFLIAVAGGFIVWLYRRFNFSKMHQLNYLRTIKVIEKRPLSPKTMLYLVEINGKQVMLAESQMEVRQVMEFEMSLDKALASTPEV